MASCRPSSFPKTIPIAQMRDAATPRAFPSTAVGDEEQLGRRGGD